MFDSPTEDIIVANNQTTLTISIGVVKAPKAFKVDMIKEYIRITNVYNTGENKTPRDLSGLKLMVLPKLLVKLVMFTVAVELVVYIPVPPQPLYSGTLALKIYSKLLTRISGIPMHLFFALTKY